MEGFDDTVHLAGGGDVTALYPNGSPFTAALSLHQQQLWCTSVAQGLERREELAAKKKKKANEISEEALGAGEDAEETAEKLNFYLESSTGWPVDTRPEEDREDEGPLTSTTAHGIPFFKVALRVSIPPGVFPIDVPVTVSTFKTYFGGLPKSAQAHLTHELYRVLNTRSNVPKVPLDIFLDKAEIISAARRKELFSNRVSTMDSFCGAGCKQDQFAKIMELVHGVEDPVDKVRYLNEYYTTQAAQCKNMAATNEFRSKNTQYTVQYLVEASDSVCGDLRRLVHGHVYRSEALEHRTDADIHTQQWANNPETFTYWRMKSTSSFLTANWLTEDLVRAFNMLYWFFTFYNVQVRTHMIISKVSYRTGQSNNWDWMGHLNTIINAGGKIPRRIPNDTAWRMTTDKIATAGADMVREADDEINGMHVHYRKANVVDDDTKLVQFKRGTPASLAAGALVKEVDGVVQSAPRDKLGRNIVNTEGPGNDPEVTARLFLLVPRDGDNQYETWNTANMNQDDLRQSVVERVVPGWPPFIILTCKNNPLRPEAEVSSFTRWGNVGCALCASDHRSVKQVRWLQMIIVANILCANAPVDHAGLRRNGDGAKDPFQTRSEDLDEPFSSRGFAGSRSNDRGVKKGPKCPPAEQARWAPFFYYSQAIAGTYIGIMNKIGVYGLDIDYGVKGIFKFLTKAADSGLRDFVSDEDKKNCSRYHECTLCRGVAETVWKTTVMYMLKSPNVDAVVFHSIRTLTNDSLHLSLVPPMLERYIVRAMRYDCFVAVATVGLELDVPVVDLDMLLGLYDDRPITDEGAAKVLRDFIQKCWDKKMFLNEECIEGGEVGRAGDTPVPYITSPGEWFSTAGSLRDKVPQDRENRKPDFIVRSLSKKIYDANESPLQECSCFSNWEQFHRCVESAMHPFDLKCFFGGMKAMGDSSRLLGKLGLDFASRFPGTGGRQGESDDRGGRKVLTVGKLEGDNVCVAASLWDILLWFAVMKRPRRDYSVSYDIAFTFTQFLINRLPKSAFPYPEVPMTRLDPVTMQQVVMDFDGHGENGRVNSHIVRPPNRAAVTGNFKLDCEGQVGTRVLEDEKWMSTVVSMAMRLRVGINEFPLDLCKVGNPPSSPLCRGAHCCSGGG